jgi:hypothetical protein
MEACRSELKEVEESDGDGRWFGWEEEVHIYGRLPGAGLDGWQRDGQRLFFSFPLIARPLAAHP